MAVVKRNPESTRQRILDAAFDEFCELGLAGARVDRIARRARVNKRMLYHYFGSKAELFTELLHRKAGEAADVRAKGPESLGEALAYHQESQCEDARWTRLLMHEALARGSASIANEDERRAGWDGVVRALRTAQREGRAAPELDARQLQLSLVALVTFPVAFPQYTKLITGREPDDPAFLRERRRFLRALGKRLGSP